MARADLVKKYSSFSAYLSSYDNGSEKLFNEFAEELSKTPDDILVGDIVAIRKHFLSIYQKADLPKEPIQRVIKILMDSHEALKTSEGMITLPLYEHFGRDIISLKPNHIDKSISENPRVVKDLIRMDFLQYMPSSLQFLPDILDKLEHVHSEEPEFFEEYTKVIWLPYIQLIYRATRQINIPHILIQRCLKFYRIDHLQKSLEKHGELYRINNLHKSVIQYALGIPFIGTNFTKAELFRLLRKALSNKNAWNARIKKYNQQHLKEHIRRMSLFDKKNIVATNEKNTLLDDIDEYNPEDIFYLLDKDNKLFRFTHNEFESIATLGKNPFTMVPLQHNTIAAMKNNLSSRRCVIESSRVIEMIEAMVDPQITFLQYLQFEATEQLKEQQKLFGIMFGQVGSSS